MKHHKIGKIINPHNIQLRDHEQFVVDALIHISYDVEILPETRLRTPDIAFNGRRWEIKSPIGGKSSRTIENNIRNAKHQSPNIIINLCRYKSIENKAIQNATKQAKTKRGIKHLLVITKDQKILEIK